MYEVNIKHAFELNKMHRREVLSIENVGKLLLRFTAILLSGYVEIGIRRIFLMAIKFVRFSNFFNLDIFCSIAEN